MAFLNINISGRRGLLERHQGDLDDSSAVVNLRYIGEDGQFADGVFNPFKKYGYLNPANGKFASLTGTVAAPVNKIVYEPTTDTVFLSEQGENILQLDGLDDTSLSNYLSLTAGSEIQDMLLYELGGSKALFYINDTNSSNGIEVGFKSIDTKKGATVLRNCIIDLPNNEKTEIDLKNTASNPASAGRQLAQSFDSDDLTSLTITGARIRLRRKAGTGAGITLKLSIQAGADPATSPYSDQGAWTTATGYSVNDTVTQSGTRYMCYSAHTSAANTQPGVGALWETVWQVFGFPDGTELVSGTFSGADIRVGAVDIDYENLFVEFSAPYTLTAGTQYWLVLSEVGTNMTSGDTFSWLITGAGSTGSYANGLGYAFIDSGTPDYWSRVFPGDSSLALDFDFSLILNESESWSRTIADGGFTQETGANTFLFLSENALLYWFVDNSVHTFDGGLTGGVTGRAVKDVLTFPTYINVIDVEEIRSRMYIGIQSSDVSNSSDQGYYNADIIGAFVWDKRSQLFSSTDFYPAIGAKEIKKMFISSSGNVMMLTVSNTGYGEIRAIIGNQYGVVQTFEKNGYPTSRSTVSYINNMAVWLGQNGIFYAYGAVAPGEPEQLYKIGDMSAEHNAGFVPHALFVGNETAGTNTTGVYFAWEDSDPSYIVQKWYPSGEGTINAVAQTANVGNAYTKVYNFPTPTHVEWAQIYFAPIPAATGTTTVATVKYYLNKSTTAKSFTIQAKDLAKGYFYMPIGQKNVYSIQFEIEWATGVTLGSTDLQPTNIIVSYKDNIIKKK